MARGMKNQNGLPPEFHTKLSIKKVWKNLKEIIPPTKCTTCRSSPDAELEKNTTCVDGLKTVAVRLLLQHRICLEREVPLYFDMLLQFYVHLLT